MRLLQLHGCRSKMLHGVAWCTRLRCIIGYSLVLSAASEKIGGPYIGPSIVLSEELARFR